MSKTAMLPAEVFHPMDYLADALRERGWSLDDFAMRLVRFKPEAFGVERLSLDLYALRDVDCHAGDEAFENWARVLGTSAELWQNIEKTWRANAERTGYVAISPELDEPSIVHITESPAVESLSRPITQDKT
jgi:hypothetical protein